MAGVKGRSGGARKGAGAKRKGTARPDGGPVGAAAPAAAPNPAPGAAVPPAGLQAAEPGDTDQPVVQLPEDAQGAPIPACANPLDFLERVMNDTRLGLRERLRAAVAAAQYRHAKRADEGKKKTAEVKAKETAGESRLRPMEPPKLQAVPGRRA